MPLGCLARFFLRVAITGYEYAREGASQDHENASFTRSIAGCLRFFTLI
jgi:hypothetical protein